MKKAYMFIVDAIISLFVLSLGILLLVSSASSPVKHQVQFLSQDLLNALATNEIANIGNDFSGSGGVLVVAGRDPDAAFITDIRKTALEQIGEFYYRYETDDNCNQGWYYDEGKDDNFQLLNLEDEIVCTERAECIPPDETPETHNCCYNTDLYCKCCIDIANEFTKNIIIHLVPRHSVEVKINDVVLYSDIKKPKEKARVLLPARTLVHGEFDNDFYGPYTAEVLVWQ